MKPVKSGKIKFSDSSELNFSQENNYCFLTLKDIPTDQEKESLTLFGISFLEYIPKNTYLVNIPKNFKTSIDGLPVTYYFKSMDNQLIVPKKK